MRVTKPIGILVAPLLLLLSACVAGAARSTKTPWNDRVVIISDFSEAEGCPVAGPVKLALKKEWTDQQKVDRLKKWSWEHQCDRVLLIEDTWKSEYVEGMMFQCLFVRQVESRNDVEDCEFVGKVTKFINPQFRLETPDGEAGNHVMVSQLDRIAWEMEADTLFVLSVQANAGYGEAYRCFPAE